MPSNFVSNPTPKHTQNFNRWKTKSIERIEFYPDSVVNVIERPMKADKKYDDIKKQEPNILYLTAAKTPKYVQRILNVVVKRPLNEVINNQSKWRKESRIETGLNPTLEFLWDATQFTGFERRKQSLQPEINESVLDYMDFEDNDEVDNNGKLIVKRIWCDSNEI